MRVEVQIAGFGGQGIVLAGVVLAEAALRDGKNVVQSQSYGPEARGGAARSDIVISDHAVDYPKVLSPQVLVALSQPAFDKYAPNDLGGILVIVDSDLVKDKKTNPRQAPFTKIADSLGRKIVANMVMLGFLASAGSVASRDSLLAAIENNVPKGTFDLNKKAFDEGYELGSKEEARG